MNVLNKTIASLLFAFCTLSLPMEAKPKVKSEGVGQKFLMRHDLVFDTLITKWEEGLFTGNGLLGNMVYMKNRQALRIEIGRTDVTEHQQSPTIPNLYGTARLPIGHFELKPSGKILRNAARLDLWNAEARGVVTTDRGTIHWRTLTLVEENVIVFETTASEGEENFLWEWNPQAALSTRAIYMGEDNIPKDYKQNPPHVKGRDGTIDFCLQPLVAGGDYCTAWLTKTERKRRIAYISVGYNRRNSSKQECLALLKKTGDRSLSSLVDAHRRWWHHFYGETSVSLPDADLEKFYWVQQYKLASATRSDKPAIDLMGPWFRNTPWPNYWLNLNIQLTYSSLYAGNRLSLAESFLKLIDRNVENLALNVPSEYRHNSLAMARSGGSDLRGVVRVYSERDKQASDAELELGNLTWSLYYYWQHYRYSMDEQIKLRLLPLLKKSINYYLCLLEKGDDGKWHLPYTYSPEYPGGVTRDCNYDLSLLRWGCQTLLTLAPSDGLASKWKDVLDNLTDYPVDENGYRIGRDVPFAKSHRHYSHLLMIYPLYIVNREQVANRALIEKSLEHWHSFPQALQGYSFTGGASIYAMMGNGDKARDYLKTLLHRFIKPNTMYLETGPVIETPLAAVASLQEMLLQSWGDKIRVFPAIPGDWKDVGFDNLRAEGAFLVSARRQNGTTKWVRVKSLTGAPCVIRPNLVGVVKVVGTGRLIPLAEELYKLDLK